MQQKKKLAVFVGLILAAIVFFAAGLVLLPDMLVMQITLSGAAGTTMPKPLGLALPLIITCGFAFAWYRSDENKNLFYAGVGLFLNLFTFFMNG